MQKLFDIEKALMLIPNMNKERLMKILKIVKDYDYIFEVVDDEFQDHWNFGEYEYSKEEGDKRAAWKHKITRSHAKRDTVIGLEIAFVRQPCPCYIDIRLGNLNGY